VASTVLTDNLGMVIDEAKKVLTFFFRSNNRTFNFICQNEGKLTLRTLIGVENYSSHVQYNSD
jgi:hypothetical protein